MHVALRKNGSELGVSYSRVDYMCDLDELLERIEEMRSAERRTIALRARRQANSFLMDIVTTIRLGLGWEGFKPILEASLERLTDAGDYLCVRASPCLSRGYITYRNLLAHVNPAPNYDA